MNVFIGAYFWVCVCGMIVTHFWFVIRKLEVDCNSFKFSDSWGALQRGLWGSPMTLDTGAGSAKSPQPHSVASSDLIA